MGPGNARFNRACVYRTFPARQAASAMLGPMHAKNRPLPVRTALAAALVAVLLALPAAAQESARLPDIGSSAATVLSPAKQREYGEALDQARDVNATRH